MAATQDNDGEEFISIALDRDGQFLESRRGRHVVREFRREPPDNQKLVKVLTIEIYRDTSPTTGGGTRPPCWEFVNPPGRWICGCEKPDCPD
jgi:hypothetical protein